MKKIFQNTVCLIFGITLNCVLSQAQTMTTTPSNYIGYNVSCFSGENGEINLTINGSTRGSIRIKLRVNP